MTTTVRKGLLVGACAALALLSIAALVPSFSESHEPTAKKLREIPQQHTATDVQRSEPDSLADDGERVYGRIQAPDAARVPAKTPEPDAAATEPVDFTEAEALLEAAQEEAALTSENEARLIRLPVISALRGNHPNDEARHRAMRRALEASGASEEPWTDQASSVFESWNAALSDETARSFDGSSVRCFKAGCEVLVSFSNAAAYENAAREFRNIREGESGHGGRVQTPLVPLADGRVQAAWMLLRPDDSGS